MPKPLMTMSKVWEIISMLFSCVPAPIFPCHISIIWPSHQSIWTPCSLYYSNRSFPHGRITTSWAICPATPAAPRVDIPAPSIPCLKPVLHVSKHKICEEFSANDIDQLLHAIISANPYLAPVPRSPTNGRRLQKIVQAEGMYWADHETLKNKVKSLLTWVQVCLIFIFIFIHFYIFQIG